MLTEAQLARRKRGIGSSDIAAIVGLSSWASPIDVWIDKTGRGKSFAGNIATRVGSALEPLIADLYAERTGARLSEPSQTHAHPVDDWRVATPDRIAHFSDREKVVECKNATYGGPEWGDDGTDAIPLPYVCQVQWQLDVIGLDDADVAALIGHRLHVYHVRRDEELCAQLREAGAAFWRDHVLADVQPPLDGSEGTRAYLARKYPTSNGLIIAADTAADDIAERLARAKVAFDSAGSDVERLANELRERIGDNDGIQGATWKASWKRARDKRKTDWQAVARECGASTATIERYTTTEPGSRRFLFTPPKEG